MSKSTTYSVKVNGTVADTRSKKSSAITLAEQALAREPGDTVEVTTEAGTVVWPEVDVEVEATTEAEVTEVTSNRAAPYTRTDASEALPTEVDGHALAYTRNRVNAGVYRSGKTYLVVQFKDGEEVLREEAANTTEAREITNRLADEHREAVAEAKAAEKVQKAADKEAKAAAKVAKVQADADAKAAKLAAKEAEAAAAVEVELEPASA